MRATAEITTGPAEQQVSTDTVARGGGPRRARAVTDIDGSQRRPAVPWRPRLLAGIPALRRDDGGIQLGMEPRHAVVLRGLSVPLLERLAGLDGSKTRAELLEATAAPEREALLAVLAELARGRLVEDAATSQAPGRVRTPPGWRLREEPDAGRFAADATSWMLRTGRPSGAMRPSRSRAVAVVHGDGRIAVALGCLLAAAGVGWVRVCARGTVTAEDLGSGYLAADIGKSRATAAARALHRAAGAVRTAPVPPGTDAGIVVLSDCAVPPPTLVARLHAAGTPHLLAYAREGNGFVGPVVFPHATSCLRCLDLHRTDRDADWPAVSAQLAGAATPADIAGAMSVASYATGQALRVLDGEHPSVDGSDRLLCDRSVELNAFDGELQRRHWAPHPTCDCGAAP